MATGRSSSARPGDDLLSQTAEAWVGGQDQTFHDPSLDSPANRGTASELQSQPVEGDHWRRDPAADEGPEQDTHYGAWRQARLAALDEEYRQWRAARSDRFDRGYGRWRESGGNRFDEFPSWMDGWRDDGE